MVEMLTGSHPWPNVKDNLPYIFKLSQLKVNEIPEFKLEENVCDDLREVLRLTFTLNYEKRPSSKQLLGHLFFK